MRNLIKTRAASVTIAALEGNWRRDSVALTGPGGAPEIRWTAPDGLIYRSDDPEVFPEPLRQAKRVELICLFSRRCRLCGAEARWLTEEQLAMLDPGRVFVVRFVRHRVATESHTVQRSKHVFAVEHAPDCAARPELIEAMNAAAAN